MKNKNFDLLVMSGFSGVGKGTLLQMVLKDYPELELIQSYTTRPQRGENEYYRFIDRVQFEGLQRAGFFLETNTYGGEGYGTAAYDVRISIDSGHIPVLEVDHNGFRQILRAPQLKGLRIRSVFICTDANTLAQRLVGRGSETMRSLSRRLLTAADEADHIQEYEAVIINENLAEAAANLKALIEGHSIESVAFDAEGFKERVREIARMLEIEE